ncbi:MAG TPA: hypothetical protein VMV69_22225 [Pirellulales bacterium]|nr:hypothetical protein [Pirellulales bacterium]
MAAVTFAEGSRAAIVPAGSVYDLTNHAIVLPAATARPAIAGSEIGDRSAQSKNLGVVFTIILLLVVFITNTPLRGLWSAIAILLILVMTVTFAWLGIWADVLATFGRISIHMNMGFYMFFSSLLFILWAVVVFFFDRMHYWKFRPGQLTYESWFGGGQKSYDTAGMLFEKLRDDPFRHWVLGLGSGDLVIAASGARREQIQIPNVLFLGPKLTRLQKMVAERPD